MTYEVEQKFRVSDLRATERALRDFGAKLTDGKTQSDTYFSHPARDFKKSDEILRLRCDGDTNCVTYKGPRIDSETKTRLELEIDLPKGADAADQLRSLFGLLGFEVFIDVRKRRRTANLQSEGHAVEVALDEVEGLGTFVELEIVANEAGVDAARVQLVSVAERLGLNRIERRSYSELMSQLSGE